LNYQLVSDEHRSTTHSFRHTQESTASTLLCRISTFLPYSLLVILDSTASNTTINIKLKGKTSNEVISVKGLVSTTSKEQLQPFRLFIFCIKVSLARLWINSLELPLPFTEHVCYTNLRSCPRQIYSTFHRLELRYTRGASTLGTIDICFTIAITNATSSSWLRAGYHLWLYAYWLTYACTTKIIWYHTCLLIIKFLNLVRFASGYLYLSFDSSPAKKRISDWSLSYVLQASEQSRRYNTFSASTRSKIFKVSISINAITRISFLFLTFIGTRRVVEASPLPWSTTWLGIFHRLLST